MSDILRLVLTVVAEMLFGWLIGAVPERQPWRGIVIGVYSAIALMAIAAGAALILA